MHPAPSLIIFTTLSGLGFGLLFWLGLGYPDVSGWVAATFLGLGFVLAGIGLGAAALHLGNPQRAWRAFSQWRSSWLSREAVMSVAALSVMALYGAIWVFAGERLPILGAIGAALCAATVFATAMIYAQLKTVPRWNSWATPALFLTIAAAGGAALASLVFLAAFLMLLGGILQGVAWVTGDNRAEKPHSTIESATGLGAIGKVRAFAAPHTGENYLLREMVHQIGRKHIKRLRVISMLLGYTLPAIVMATDPSHTEAAVALASHLVGVLAGRWLFFAQAEHVMGLYYGKGQSDQ